MDLLPASGLHLFSLKYISTRKILILLFFVFVSLQLLQAYNKSRG